MAILITGGASQVGGAIARVLKADKTQTIIIGSRSGRVPAGFTPSESVKFDWADPSTFANPFAFASGIKAVYILLPPGYVDPSEGIKKFVDIAVERGVGRFVLLSGSAVGKDVRGFGISEVWRYLDEKGVDYFALRPTWFFDNFVQFHGKSVREKDEFKSVMPNAKIPMVSVANIAQFAKGVFLNEKNSRTEQRIVGPELLTYDQAAEILTRVLGRKITHKVVSPEELTQHYVNVFGWPEEYARFLVGAEQEVDAGSEERWWGAPDNFVGQETMSQWAERNKEKLAPARK